MVVANHFSPDLLEASLLELSVEGVQEMAWDVVAEPPNLPSRVQAVVSLTLLNYYKLMGWE